MADAADAPQVAVVMADKAPSSSPAAKPAAAVVSPGSPSTTKADPTKAAPPTEAVSLTKLFRFATAFDVFLLVAACVCAAGSGVVMPLFSIILGDLFNALNVPGNFDAAINDLCAKMGGLALGMGVAQYLTSTLAGLSATRQIARLRTSYMSALLRQDAGWHDQGKAAEAATRMAADTVAIEGALGQRLTVVVNSTATFFAGFIIAFVQGWKMALVILGFIPIFVVLGAFAHKAMAGAGKEGGDAYARAGAIATEALALIRTVAAFGGERAELARYDAALAKSQLAGHKAAFGTGIGIGLLMMNMFSVYAVGFYFGGRLVIWDREGDATCGSPFPPVSCFTGGDVINVIFALLMGGGALGQAGPAIATIFEARGAAVGIFAVIDRVPPIDTSSAAGLRPALADVRGRIEFRNVSFAYPSRPQEPILKNFSIVIEPNTTVALVGTSGSGKSTIVALIQRQYDPQEGEILLDGVNVKEYNVQALRAVQAIVSQEPQLFAATVRENIALGAVGAASSSSPAGSAVPFERIEAAARAANAHDFISALPKAYDTPVTGAQLSGGQKQRLAIARAILREPRILLLDEATSALDTTSERLIQRDLDRLLEESRAAGSSGGGGRTAVMVAHRLSTVTRADSIVVMERGRIVESGSHSDLMAREDSVYRRLRELQRVQEGEVDIDIDLMLAAAEKVQEDRAAAAAFVDAAAAAAAASASSASASSSASSLAAAAASSAKVEPSASAANGGGKTKQTPAEVAAAAAAAALAEAKKSGKSADEIASAEKEAQEKAQLAEDMRNPPVSYSRLFAYAGPDAHYFYIGCFFSAVMGCMFPIMSILFARFLSVFYEPDNAVLLNSITLYMIYFFILAGSAFVSVFFQQYFFGRVKEGVMRRLRIALFSSVIRQPVGWHDLPANTSGRITSRLAGDTALLGQTLGMNMALNVQNVVQLVVGLVIAFTASWRLTLVVLLVAPLLGVGAALQMKYFRGFEEAAQKQMAPCADIATEAMTASRTVAAFSLQAATSDRFAVALRKPTASAMKGALVSGVGASLANVVMIGVYAVSFYAGAQFIKAGNMTFAELMQAFFSVVFAAMGMGQASGLAVDAGRAEAAKRAIFAVLDAPSAIDPFSTEGIVEAADLKKKMQRGSNYKDGGAGLIVRTMAASGAGDADEGGEGSSLPEDGGSIEFVDVSFTYPSRPDAPVLRGLSFKVQAGRTVALVGPSGSGKSTVVQLLERFYDPASGSVLIDGVNMKEYNVQALRNRMGWVQQEAPLFADSIAYNIAYGAVDGAKGGAPAKLPANCGVRPDAAAEAKDKASAATAGGSGKGAAPAAAEKKSADDESSGNSSSVPSAFTLPPAVEKAARSANAFDFISSFKHAFATYAGERGNQLSGGQKQRVAVARAILREPRILLLDEATSALDSESERVVQASIDRLLEEAKRGGLEGGQRRTTLVIAHRLSTIKRADEIVVIDRGRVVERGTHEQLMVAPGEAPAASSHGLEPAPLGPVGVYRRMVLEQDAGMAASGGGAPASRSSSAALDAMAAAH